jgi:hypothetical protein
MCAHPRALLRKLGGVPGPAVPGWALDAYREAAMRMLGRAGRIAAPESVDCVMRELILPRALAHSMTPAEIGAANPYVEPAMLLQLYVLQRGGSGVFEAVR